MSTCGQPDTAVHSAACVQHCAYPSAHKRAAPVPVWDEGLRGGAALPQGPAASLRAAGGRRVRCQRQRIDMTRPATMRPKPMAKFHALSEDMNGICSPAT